MAVRWLEGFDHYGTTPNGGRDTMLAGVWSEFSVKGTAPQISADQSRTSGFSLKFTANNLNNANEYFARRALGAAMTQFGFGSAIYMVALPTVSGALGVRFSDADNVPTITLAYQTDGSIQVFRGSAASGALLATSGQVLTAQAWNHVEVFVNHHASAGAVEVRVNGVTVVNVTGANTGSTPSAQLRLGNIHFGSDPVYKAIGEHFWDDLTCWDTTGPRNNTFLGAQKVVLNKVAADTDVADWTVTGAASGAAAISEIPPNGDTSYISATTPGETSEFTVEPLDENVVSITAVYLPAMMRQSQPGTTWVQQGIVSGGDVALGLDRPITEAYTYWADVIEVDPDTGAPWTRASYNASRRRFVKTV